MSTAGPGTSAPFPPPDPTTFSEGRPPRRRLSRRARAFLGGATVVALLAAGTATTLSVRDALSWQRFDEASTTLVESAEAHDEAVDDWAELRAAVETETRVREPLADADAAAVDSAARDAYLAAIDRLLDSSDDVDAARRAAVAPPLAPEDAEGRFAAADEFDARSRTLDDEAEEQQEQAERVRPLLGDVRAASAAFTTATEAVSRALIVASTAATHESRLLVERALYGYGSTRIPLDLSEPTTLRAYLSQVAALQRSQAEGLAERSAPEWPDKEAVIDFAESLSGGVPLDVSWEETIEIDGVAYGSSGSGAGLATWDLDEGAPGTITLTESVHREWGSPWTQGLVAHEVGHAITAKDGCYELYRAAPFEGDDEKWATAWALSLGYTEGSGTEPYGDPGEEAVAIASACR